MRESERKWPRRRAEGQLVLSRLRKGRPRTGRRAAHGRPSPAPVHAVTLARSLQAEVAQEKAQNRRIIGEEKGRGSGGGGGDDTTAEIENQDSAGPDHCCCWGTGLTAIPRAPAVDYRRIQEFRVAAENYTETQQETRQGSRDVGRGSRIGRGNGGGAAELRVQCFFNEGAEELCDDGLR